MSERKAFRNKFTVQQFKKYEQAFAALPKSLADPASPNNLANLWQRGGTGAISILPQLSMIAGLRCRNAFALSAEELSRLVGCHPISIRKARAVYLDLGLASTDLCERRGKQLLSWALSDALAGEKLAGGRFSEHYSSFPMTWIHGGQWMMLSAIEKLVFLAIALRSTTHRDRPADNWLLNEDLAAGVSREDFEADFESSEGCWFRMASVSIDELATITGASRSSVGKAVQSFKAPQVWGSEARTDARSMAYSPVWAYPTDGGNLIYHIRGHVRPWPLDILNDPQVSKWSDEEIAAQLEKAQVFIPTRNRVKNISDTDIRLHPTSEATPKSLLSVTSSQVQDAFDHWKTTCHIAHASLDKKAAMAFRAVIEEFGLSKVKDVANYAANDPYLNGTKTGRNLLWWTHLYKDPGTTSKHLQDSRRSDARDTRAIHLSATRQLTGVDVF